MGQVTSPSTRESAEACVERESERHRLRRAVGSTAFEPEKWKVGQVYRWRHTVGLLKPRVTPVFQTIGQEEFDRLRSLSYAETHVVMMCFSVSRNSQRLSF
jgi:GTPase SAR1 family protein